MITVIQIVKERKEGNKERKAERKKKKERKGKENMMTIFNHKRPVKQIIIHQ